MSSEPFARILFDEPVDHDAFDGKGHERSAKGLADSIVQLANRGKDGAIGLEGTWGSGKSTVVSLTEGMLKKLDAGREYHIFVFDMWVHQTDEFRHAFLDAFLAWVDSKGQTLLLKNEIKKARQKISGKTRTVETDNRKQYTLPAILVLVALPFIPLALNWTTPVAFDKDHAATLWGHPVQATVLTAYLVVAAAILSLSLPVALWAWFRPVVQRGYAWTIRRWNERAWHNAPKAGDYPTLREALSSAVSVFRHEVKKDIVTQSIRDEDPTNSEFHKVFRDMLRRAQQKNRRIVFVLDNIDRLGGADVRKAWSEIRAVFVNGNHQAAHVDGGGAGVIAVVPYDRAHVLGRAVSADADTEEDFTPFGGGDILSKTFNRIVKVAPPVPGDWHKYIDDQINLVFGDQFSDQECYKLYKLLDIHLQIRREMVTPRRIIAYLNELGAFWTQWKDTIPAPTIALYVLLRGQIENDPDVLKQAGDSKWGRYLRALNEPRWRQHFVALAYNVLPDRSNQVLLGQDIARELVADTPDALVKLGAQDGFSETFTNQLVESVDEHSADAAAFSKMATNIAALQTLSEGATIETWHLLGESLERLPAGPLTLNAIEGLFAVVSRQHRTDFARAADALRHYLAESATPANDKLPLTALLQLGADWVKALRALVEEVGSQLSDDRAAAYWEASRMPMDPSICIGAAAECERDGLLFSKLAKSEGWQQPIAERLQDVATVASDVLAFALPQLQSTITPASAASLIAKIGERFSEGPTDQASTRELVSAITFLFGGRQQVDEVRSALGKLQASGLLHWYLRDAVEQEEEEVAGRLLWLIVSIANAETFTAAPDESNVADTELVTWYNNLLVDQVLPKGICQKPPLVLRSMTMQRHGCCWLPRIRALPACFATHLSGLLTRTSTRHSTLSCWPQTTITSLKSWARNC